MFSETSLKIYFFLGAKTSFWTLFMFSEVSLKIYSFLGAKTSFWTLFMFSERSLKLVQQIKSRANPFRGEN